MDGDETGGAWSMVELAGPRGDMPPLHVHTRDDEAFYVFEGTVTLFVGDDEVVLGAGECAVAPRGVPHVYRVESGHARWLVITSPSGFERFVAEAAEPAAELTLPVRPPSAAPGRLAELAFRCGIEILAPPGTLPSSE